MTALKHPATTACAPSRHGLALLLAASSLAYVACLDLTVPPNVGEDAAAADANDAADAPASSGGGAGAGGRGGSGGQAGGTGGSDAGSAHDGDDGSPSGTGGRGQGGGGGKTDALVGTGGSAGATTRGTGGAGAGGTAGSTTLPEDAAGKDSPPDSGGPDSPPETPTDVASADVTADVPSPNLSAGLVAYYPCEQLEGSLLRDQSGNGNHATVEMGGGASGLGYRIEPGKIGNGLTLVQTGSGYVNMPPAAFVGSADITVATWIKLTTVTTWQRLFDVGINANLQQNTPTGTVYVTFFLKNPANKLGLGSTKDGFSNAQQFTADMLPTGTWKHIAAVIASNAATLYVDGTAVASLSPFLAPHDLGALDYAFLGRSQFQVDPYLDAQIDELRVYSRALAASEVQALVQYAGPPSVN